MIPAAIAEHFARHHASVSAERLAIMEVFVPERGWVEASGPWSVFSTDALPFGWTLVSVGYDGHAVADFTRREVEASLADASDWGIPAHPATRTSKPYVLVADGRIVGYADSRSEAVMRRAHKLHAMVVAVAR